MTRSTFLKALTALLPLKALANLVPKSSPSSSLVDLEKLNGTKSVSSTTSTVDLSRLLHAIAEVESGNNDSLEGPKGELSRYQISREVWYQHFPHLNFYLACNGVRANACAERHLNWLRDNDVPDKPYILAYAWNMGRKAAMFQLVTSTHGNTIIGNTYAARVTNLYSDPTFLVPPFHTLR